MFRSVGATIVTLFIGAVVGAILLVVALTGGVTWLAREATTEVPKAIAAKVVKLSLKAHLGPIDGIEYIDHSADKTTKVIRYRFEAAPEKVAALTARLNMVPSSMRSVADHWLKHDRNDPEWWQPETELTCCTQYRGTDASGKGILFVGYNPDRQVAYAVFTPTATADASRRDRR